MNKTTPWIASAALIATLAVAGADRTSSKEKTLAAAESPDPGSRPNHGLEAAVLQHLLLRQEARLTGVEKSALTAAIARLEHEAPEEPVPVPTELGVSVVPLDDSLRRHIQPLVEGGLKVAEARHDGLLAFWGVGESDLIVSANGHALHNARALMDALDESVEKNQPLILEVVVQGNRRMINLRPLGARMKLQPGGARFWQFAGC